MKKFKLPSKKVLKKAIKDLEESDLVYKYTSGFAGVTVEDIDFEEDYADEYDDVNDILISYSATVFYESSSETYSDCSVTWGDLKGWIK